MHLAVQARLAHDRRAVRLQGAAVVVEADAGHAADEPVRDPRRQLAGEAVLPVLPPAADDVVALVELLEQPPDVGRVVLEVAVHRDDDSPRAWSKPAAIAAVWPKFRRSWTSEPPVARGERGELRVGAVAAAVVDDDDLVRAPELVERVDELASSGSTFVLLVVDRDDDRQLGRRVVRPLATGWSAGSE